MLAERHCVASNAAHPRLLMVQMSVNGELYRQDLFYLHEIIEHKNVVAKAEN